MKNVAVITAGGSGKRMGSSQKKQFLKLGKESVIIHTIRKFIKAEIFSDFVLVFPKDSIKLAQTEIFSVFPDENLIFVEGGTERQDSVMNGLKACPEDTDYVFIHDGVRPFVIKEELKKLLDQTIECGAAIPVTPVRYTVKRVRHNNVIKTIPREELFEVHTPQVFDFSMILNLHKKAQIDGLLFTDDSGICEFYGQEVATVVSNSCNLKITHPQDLKVAEVMISLSENICE